MTDQKRNPLVEMRNINVAFGGVHAVDDVTIDLREGEVVGLVGGNGAGKSTLMRIIAGLESPDSVAVTCEGISMPWKRACQKMRNHIIYLHQQPYLFDRSVTDNIAYGLRRQGLSVKEISRKVPEALDWAGIAHLQLRNARELSGSERQRVAFADASHDQATQARRC